MRHFLGDVWMEGKLVIRKSWENWGERDSLWEILERERGFEVRVARGF